MKNILKKQSGFTLIELIIYLALFVIIIGGGMAATYQVVQNAEENSSQVFLQAEANFLLRKMDWALTGSKIIDPSNENKSDKMTIIKNISGQLVKLEFYLNEGNLMVKRNEGQALILNSSSVKVDSLFFAKEGFNLIKMEFSLEELGLRTPKNHNFSAKKYILK